MRAEVLLICGFVSLCCVLVCAQEDRNEDDTGLQVREAGGPLRLRGQGDVQMSDEPTEGVDEEKTKPKKKKTPEEIEAGKRHLIRMAASVLSDASRKGTTTVSDVRWFFCRRLKLTLYHSK